MIYRKIICLELIILLLSVGCGLKEGVVQKEPKSFLWFTGNTENAIVYIDDLSPITLNDSSYGAGVEEDENSKGSSTIHYEISPGKHSIIVKRMDEVVVNRTILLGSGITKEIKIP